MIGQYVKEQIAEVWKNQTDYDHSYLADVVVCRELGKILQEENFDFNFNPNEFLMMDDEQYNYDIEISIGEIDELIGFRYE